MRRPTDGELSLRCQPNRTRAGVLRSRALTVVLGMAASGLVLAPGPMAGAATDTVTTCSGSASTPGSLPFVVDNAGPGDVIDFSVSCPPASPIVLAGTLTIGVDLSVVGPGADTVAVSGNNSSAVLLVAAGVTASISGITIEDGLGRTGGGVDNAGTLTVTDSTVADNSSSDGGGGLWNGGTLTVTDSTVSGNSTYRAGGGGIENDQGAVTITGSTLSADNAYNGGITVGGGGIENVDGTVTATDTTFSQNIADYNGGGGGLFNDNGTTEITASTLAHNLTHRQHGAGGGNIENEFGTVSVAGSIVAESKVTEDCSGIITDAGYNLDDDGSCGFGPAEHSLSAVKPYLGPLQDNGGPTDTRAPALDSAVLDQIPTGATGNATTLCPSTDQRGEARPQGGACDIGAVELSPTSQTITSPANTSGTVHRPLSFTVTAAGTPTPRITAVGGLPRSVRFIDNGDGTATISGSPRLAGSFHLTITVTFGSGASAFVVIQSFTLTIGSG